MQTNKLLLIDAYALIFRAYYALIRAPRFTASGQNTSAIFGFVNTLQSLLRSQQPSHIGVCFDPAGPTFRHEAYDQYKAQREATPEDIKASVPIIKEIIAAYNIPIYQVDGYEADDVIGTLAHQAAKQGFDTYMVTPDKDYAQLVQPQVKMLKPGHKGDDFEILGPAEVMAKYGLASTGQVIDMLALMGDSADNIPGCPGVGQVTAVKLIAQFGSVENLIANTDKLKGALKKKVEENVEQIKFSKFLATIKTDVPVSLDAEQLKRKPVNVEELRRLFNKLEFKTLLNRIVGQEATAATPADTTPAAASGQRGTLSLFDQPAPAAPEPEVEEEVEHSNIDTTEHNYRLVVADDEAATLVQQLLGQNAPLGVHIVSEGESAMTSRMLGVAVAAKPHEAVYFPLDAMGFMLPAVAPLFTSESATIVSADVKRDMVMLYAAGIEFSARYFDTGVAHYLLQPDRNHDTRNVAQEVLAYDCITTEMLLGAKGRSQRKISQIAPQELTDSACELADMTLQLQPKLTELVEKEGIGHLLTDIELPLVQVLASMEMAGARIDEASLAEYSVTLESRIATLETECHTLAGEVFNTASPMQVGEILFGKLQLDPKAKRTKSGQYSTTEEILLKVRDRHPLVDKILELRGLRKLLSTYVSALPALVNRRTGRIHTTYNQTVTATGRLSSTAPNLQNIPVRNDEGREIRRAFIPADGNVFFSADYSQIELRLVADFANDETMLHAFEHGDDIHAITAARIYHKPLSEVTSDERRKAKTANFGILYGISAFGLAQRLSIPRSEAKMLIDGYFATFPQIQAYITRSVAQAKEKGYVTTLYGRRRMLPDINSRNAVLRQFSERNAVNAPIQGTAADVIKIAMVRIYSRMKQAGLRSRMILQVHDELNFDALPSEVDQLRDIVITEMEGAYQGRVRLTVASGTASNWLDAH